MQSVANSSSGSDITCARPRVMIFLRPGRAGSSGSSLAVARLPSLASLTPIIWRSRVGQPRYPDDLLRPSRFLPPEDSRRHFEERTSAMQGESLPPGVRDEAEILLYESRPRDLRVRHGGRIESHASRDVCEELRRVEQRIRQGRPVEIYERHVPVR